MIRVKTVEKDFGSFVLQNATQREENYGIFSFGYWENLKSIWGERKFTADDRMAVLDKMKMDKKRISSKQSLHGVKSVKCNHKYRKYLGN